MRLSDLQQSLADFSTDAEKKHITQTQLLKLFYLLEGVQEKLSISLVQFRLDLDETGDNDTVLITLDILDRYTETVNYINSKLDSEFSIDTVVMAVNELFPNSLENRVVERRYQPTFAKTKRKLEKFPSLFFELVELGKSEGVDVDEIQREITEIAAKINTDVALMVAELEKWDEQQRKVLKTEQNQQISLNDGNAIPSEKVDKITNNNNQQTLKEYVHELKQEYQTSTPHWYHLASNSVDKSNIGNSKHSNKNNIMINNVNSTNNSINNSINLNDGLSINNHVHHYT